MTLVVRAYDRPEPLIDSIRSVVRSVDPGEAIFAIKTMDDVIAESLSAFMLSLSILSAFAALAVGLALTGTYGVISYIASSRTREFAIRVALGSGGPRVTRFVLSQALALTALGLAAGLLAALLGAPVLKAASLAAGSLDVVTILPVALLIAIVGHARRRGDRSLRRGAVGESVPALLHFGDQRVAPWLRRGAVPIRTRCSRGRRTWRSTVGSHGRRRSPSTTSWSPSTEKRR